MRNKPLSFIIVGSGWRAMFYVRIAKRNPERFQLKYVLCRSGEKVGQLQKEGIPATVSVKECEEVKPDFVVVAVTKTSIFQVTKEWALKGFPVLCETPAGMSLKELRELWELKEHLRARIQVAEQYIRYPIMAAGLKAIEQGKLGEPYSVNLSVAHDYHGASLIRHMLRIGSEPVAIQGRQYSFPVRETDSRYGAITDGSIKERERTCVTMEFASGKIAYYDFSGVQYHSFIRSRHLNVQGRDGEWNDTILKFTDENHLPRQERLLPYLAPEYRDLETEELREIAAQWNPSLELEAAQDEYAIVSMMADMGDYLETGKEVYPLAQALEDVYLWLLMKKAAENPGSVIEWEPQPWNKGGEGK